MFSFLSCFKNKKSKTVNQEIENKTEELPFFGTITLSNARDYEIDNVKINENIVSIDLNFENEKINPETLNYIRNILDNIQDIENEVKSEIREYVNQDGMVKEYFKYHIEEIETQELKNYLKDTDQNLTTELKLFSKLELKRIGFFPDSPKFSAILDYRVAIEFSDDILVVILNEKGEIEKITVES
jgi:hypothetical protein